MPEKRWNPGKYPPTLLEVAVTSSILNTLGYDPVKEIFVEISSDSVDVVLRIAGQKDIRFCVGTPEQSPRAMLELARQFTEDWNKLAAQSDRDDVYATSKARLHFLEIVLKLAALGLSRPLRRVTH